MNNPRKTIVNMKGIDIMKFGFNIVVVATNENGKEIAVRYRGICKSSLILAPATVPNSIKGLIKHDLEKHGGTGHATIISSYCWRYGIIDSIKEKRVTNTIKLFQRDIIRDENEIQKIFIKNL
jgi:hypothetical protein